MIETFCILMMLFCIVLFIVKGIGHAGKALCATPKSSSKEISYELPAKIIEEDLQRKKQERKLREEKYWEDFPENVSAPPSALPVRILHQKPQLSPIFLAQKETYAYI